MFQFPKLLSLVFSTAPQISIVSLSAVHEHVLCVSITLPEEPAEHELLWNDRKPAQRPCPSYLWK